MILIGQYDSPFVRRVAIALHHYRLPFEHRPWSVWGEEAQLAEHNPLRRVPTLLLADGSALLETFAILDYLDELVGPGQALLPEAGPLRREGLRVCALAGGACDKAVSLLYASLKLLQPSPTWATRCRTQVSETFALLERERALRPSPYWLGEGMTHADIAFACAYRFTVEAHPDLLDVQRLPTLSAQARQCEALPEFTRVYLPITNNLRP